VRFYCFDMPCPVLFLIVPGLLVPADVILPVIIHVKTAAEAKECIPVLFHPVGIHAGLRILSDLSRSLERGKVLVRPFVNLIIVRIDTGQFRIRPAHAQETLGFFLNNSAGFICCHDIIRDRSNCLGTFTGGAHPGKR